MIHREVFTAALWCTTPILSRMNLTARGCSNLSQARVDVQGGLLEWQKWYAASLWKNGKRRHNLRRTSWEVSTNCKMPAVSSLYHPTGFVFNIVSSSQGHTLIYPVADERQIHHVPCLWTQLLFGCPYSRDFISKQLDTTQCRHSIQSSKRPDNSTTFKHESGNRCNIIRISQIYKSHWHGEAYRDASAISRLVFDDGSRYGDQPRRYIPVQFFVATSIPRLIQI